MDIFTPASHHDVLVLVIQVALLLFSARACGEIAQRLGQPAVVGEILSGVILGPSLLSGFFPALGAWIVPQTEVQGYLLETVSLLGAMFLLIITGLETDLPLIRHHARTAVGVSLGGILVTFSSGFLLASYLPDFLLADPERRLVFVLFVATSMSVSAIPVVAKVLMDLNLMRRNIGQTILASGMIDDTTAWILLSIVLGVASGAATTPGTLLFTAGKILGFIVLSFTLGRWIIRRALNFVQDRVRSSERILSLVVVMAFAWGAMTQALEIEAVLGAFIVGILFGTLPRLPEAVVHKLESVTLGIFAPIFFAVAGLKVNVRSLLEPQLLALALAVLGVAILGKIVGTYLGGRLIGGVDHWTALSFGAGLNARGAVEIIIASIGLSAGILSQDMYSIVVLMAVVTSVMAPFMLRWTLQRVTPDEEEARRLRQEELAEGSLVANIDRVLLPVRRREGPTRFDIQKIETHLLGKLGPDVAVTLLNVTPKGTKADATAYLNDLSELFDHKDLSKKVVEGSPVDVILEEAGKDYDLIILGASEKASGSDVVFNPVTDQIMRLAPCPTMIVKGKAVDQHWPPERILVPTNGSAASRHAAEVAFALAAGGEAHVALLNVVEENGSRGYHLDTSGEARERQLSNAFQIVGSLRELGESRGVYAETEVRVGPSPEAVILEVAERGAFDLVILGTDLRPGSQRVFLGPRVETILDRTPCPVIIFNAT